MKLLQSYYLLMKDDEYKEITIKYYEYMKYYTVTFNEDEYMYLNPSIIPLSVVLSDSNRTITFTPKSITYDIGNKSLKYMNDKYTKWNIGKITGNSKNYQRYEKELRTNSFYIEGLVQRGFMEEQKPLSKQPLNDPKLNQIYDHIDLPPVMKKGIENYLRMYKSENKYYPYPAELNRKFELQGTKLFWDTIKSNL